MTVHKENSHITDFPKLRDDLSKIVNIEYAALTPSGQGVFCLVRIEKPELHEQHFNALILCFRQLGINIDQKCGNVNRLRFFLPDPDAILKDEEPVPFTHTLESKPNFTPAKAYVPSSSNALSLPTRKHKDTSAQVEAIISRIENECVDLTGDYGDWIKLGFALAHEFGEAGREIFHS